MEVNDFPVAVCKSDGRWSIFNNVSKTSCLKHYVQTKEFAVNKYSSPKYKYEYKYLVLKYEYKYKYLDLVLEYNSSTSTSTKYYSSIYCLIVPHRNCMRKKVQMRPFQLAKMKKNRRFQGWFFEKFSGGTDPTPLSAPALRASAPRSGPSVPPSSGVPQLQICHYTTDDILVCINKFPSFKLSKAIITYRWNTVLRYKAILNCQNLELYIPPSLFGHVTIWFSGGHFLYALHCHQVAI